MQWSLCVCEGVGGVRSQKQYKKCGSSVSLLAPMEETLVLGWSAFWGWGLGGKQQVGRGWLDGERSEESVGYAIWVG